MQKTSLKCTFLESKIEVRISGQLCTVGMIRKVVEEKVSSTDSGKIIKTTSYFDRKSLLCTLVLRK